MIRLDDGYRQIGSSGLPPHAEAIFSENGFNDYEPHLTRGCRTREYTVQFNETDFDFISHLMEEEAIYCYFNHSAGKHTIVLCDNYTSHSPLKSVLVGKKHSARVGSETVGNSS